MDTMKIILVLLSSILTLGVGIMLIFLKMILNQIGQNAEKIIGIAEEVAVIMATLKCFDDLRISVGNLNIRINQIEYRLDDIARKRETDI